MFTPFQSGIARIRTLSVVWFASLAIVVTVAWADHPNGVTGLTHAATDPLLHSGSLVIAALLLLIGVLLVAVYALYRDNKINNEERQALALRTLQVLTDLDTTIQANTEARVRVGG